MLSEKYKRLLIDNRDKIVSSLSVKQEAFWAGLVAKRVLTDEDREDIEVSSFITQLISYREVVADNDILNNFAT